MQSAWIKHRGPCTMMAFRSYSRGRGHSCWWGHSWWGHSWWWGHWWWGDHCFLRDSSWRNLSRLHEDCFRFEYPLWPENLAFQKTCFFSQAPWCPALAQTETAAASATSADGRMGKVFSTKPELLTAAQTRRALLRLASNGHVISKENEAITIGVHSCQTSSFEYEDEALVNVSNIHICFMHTHACTMSHMPWFCSCKANNKQRNTRLLLKLHHVGIIFHIQQPQTPLIEDVIKIGNSLDSWGNQAHAVVAPCRGLLQCLKKYPPP